MAKDRGVLISSVAAKQIAAATRHVSRDVRGDLGRGDRRIPVYVAAGMAVRPALSPAGGIPARSGMIPGSGSCRFYNWDRTTLTLSNETVTARNLYSSAIGASRFIWLAWWSGDWWVLEEDCAAAPSSGGEALAVSGLSASAFSTGFAAVDAGTRGEAGGGFNDAFTSGFRGAAPASGSPTLTGRKIWRLEITGGTPSSGTQVVALPGGLGSTSGLAYNAAASAVQAAFEAVGGTGNFSASGGPWPGAPIDVAAVGDYDYADFLAPVAGASTLNAGTLSVSVYQAASGTGNDTQSIYAIVAATAGQISVGYSPSSSVVVDWDEDAASLQTKMDAEWGAGNSVVSGGPLPGTPIRITWAGTYAGVDRATMGVVFQSMSFDGHYDVGAVADGVP